MKTSDVKDVWINTGLAIVGFVGLVGIIGYYQMNPTEEQRAKAKIERSTEIGKELIKSNKELATTAGRNQVGYAKQIQLQGVTVGQPLRPVIPSDRFNTELRVIVLDGNGKCIGFLQDGGFYSTHYYDFPDYFHFQDACVGIDRPDWQALPPPTDRDLSTPAPQSPNQIEVVPSR